jgi:hypothetical protein
MAKKKKNAAIENYDTAVSFHIQFLFKLIGKAL